MCALASCRYFLVAQTTAVVDVLSFSFDPFENFQVQKGYALMIHIHATFQRRYVYASPQWSWVLWLLVWNHHHIDIHLLTKATAMFVRENWKISLN